MPLLNRGYGCIDVTKTIRLDWLLQHLPRHSRLEVSSSIPLERIFFCSIGCCNGRRRKRSARAMQLLRGSDVQIPDPRALRLLLCTLGHAQDDFFYCTGGSTVTIVNPKPAFSKRPSTAVLPVVVVIIYRNLILYTHIHTQHLYLHRPD